MDRFIPGTFFNSQGCFKKRGARNRGGQGLHRGPDHFEAPGFLVLRLQGRVTAGVTEAFALDYPVGTHLQSYR